MKASDKIEKKIQESLPQLFQDHLMCAGVNVENQGACQGDSGGPLMYKDDDSRKYIQIATVRGGVGECGDDEYPGIFVRLDHPSIWKFINSTLKGKLLIFLYYLVYYF
jgi:secreted trypsin-like serine protease